jgi:hypothetical protein
MNSAVHKTSTPWNTPLTYNKPLPASQGLLPSTQPRLLGGLAGKSRHVVRAPCSCSTHSRSGKWVHAQVHLPLGSTLSHVHQKCTVLMDTIPTTRVHHGHGCATCTTPIPQRLHWLGSPSAAGRKTHSSKGLPTTGQLHCPHRPPCQQLLHTSTCPSKPTSAGPWQCTRLAGHY